MVYVSEDYGTTWKLITTGLPQSPVNIIKEDPGKEDLLYVGNDMGVFISMDRGSAWSFASSQMPCVPVHDLVIHPRDGDLVVATHGRSVYVADIKPLRKLLDITQQEVAWLDSTEVEFSKNRGTSWSMWDEPVTPGITYAVWSKNGSGDQPVLFTVKDAKGLVIYTSTVRLHKGINYVTYDLSVADNAVKTYIENYLSAGATEIKRDKTRNGKTYVLPGRHTLVLSVGNRDITAPLNIFIPAK